VGVGHGSVFHTPVRVPTGEELAGTLVHV
jgi:hypothetical protein